MAIQVSFQWLGLGNVSEDAVLAAVGSNSSSLVVVVLGLGAVFLLALVARLRGGSARLEEFGGYESKAPDQDQPLPVVDVRDSDGNDRSTVTMAAIARGLIPPEPAVADSADDPAVAPPSIDTVSDDVEQVPASTTSDAQPSDDSLRYTPLAETAARFPAPKPSVDTVDTAEPQPVSPVASSPTQPVPLPDAETVPRAMPASAYAGGAAEGQISVAPAQAEPVSPSVDVAPPVATEETAVRTEIPVSEEERKQRYAIRRLRKRGAFYRARLAEEQLARFVAARLGIGAPADASDVVVDFEAGLEDDAASTRLRKVSAPSAFAGPLPPYSLRVGHPDVLRRARAEQKRALDGAVQEGRTYRIAAIRDTLRRLDETLERIGGPVRKPVTPITSAPPPEPQVVEDPVPEAPEPVQEVVSEPPSTGDEVHADTGEPAEGTEIDFSQEIAEFEQQGALYKAARLRDQMARQRSHGPAVEPVVLLSDEGESQGEPSVHQDSDKSVFQADTGGQPFYRAAVERDARERRELGLDTDNDR